MAALLEVKDVSKSFGNFKALDGVSLSVPKGSIFGLLGPNGAGKTTLIRIVNQITMPDQGSVYLDGARWRRITLAISVTCQKNAGFINP